MATILVIDDHAHIRTIINDFLKIGGYEVDLAEDGKTAMKLAEQKAYDLVITDIIRPDYDVFDIIRGLKRLYPAVKIIAITGGGALHSSGELMDACKLFGADRALPKPLDLLKLQEVMKELLSMKEVL